MSEFDYTQDAELFPTRSRKAGRQPFSYRRFERASEAIRFAVEDLTHDLLAGAYLEVDEQRFDAKGIRRLYESDAFPLERRIRGSYDSAAFPLPRRAAV